MIRRRVIPPAVLFAAAMAGCAPLPPTAFVHPPPTVHDTTRVAARPGTTSGRLTAAPVDSGPSPEALAVLGGIPEPIPPGERVAPPVVATAAAAAVARPDSAVHDTTAADLPVPSPTPVLGEHQNPALVEAAGGAAAASGAGASGAGAGTAGSAGASGAGAAASGGAAAAAAGAAPASQGTQSCWRVQVAAPKERDEADKKRAAAESLLLAPMVIEDEGGLHKVRTRDCFERATADRLRDRARNSGFDGAFPFERKGK